ncbi:beta-Ala-His dipeptidase [Peptoniphilus sp. MSJ-1]|uniref:Beta-Ala-His dipeptidase n=1 Tax=Peptoniphilus ovalis TaxID=2841503 RepID=A0ABS6FGQ1_9FIRM|nr:beta-Ala-His dipeptidase [Peptoniphilus ovalis]MBU5668638.1 beta-Ala-His dipeptidase [Peptoniphilus ovalis]
MKEFTIESLRENPLFDNFYKISQIPHGSFNEKELSDWIYNWAKEKDLEVKQDDYSNLVIKKDGQNGGENKEPLILQAHIDMVCQKVDGSDHDFKKDPIKWVIEDEWLTTGGETTLGADNGLGVGLIMAVLESKDMNHPPITALFTTVEEDDFSGASNLPSEWVDADRAINLDNCEDYVIIAGSNGGTGAKIILETNREKIEDSKKVLKVEFSGLVGGHSGADINKGLGNSILIMGRLLEKYRENFEVSLSKISGGTFRLAIPRSSEAIVVINSKDEDKLRKVTDEFLKLIYHEYSKFKDSIKIEISETEAKDKFKDEDFVKILDIIKLSPNGVIDVNAKSFIIESSCNLGEVHTEENEVIFVSEIRAMRDSQIDYTYSRVESLARLVDAKDEQFARYFGWEFNENSDLRKQYKDIIKDIQDIDCEVRVSPGGLEGGYLINKRPGLDIICVGALHTGLHSPDERANINSVLTFYDNFKVFLERLN